MVNTPSRALSTIGSAATSSCVGRKGAVGTSSTSAPAQARAVSVRSAASEACAAKASAAVQCGPPRTTSRTTGSIPGPPPASVSPATAWRSASHGPDVEQPARGEERVEVDLDDRVGHVRRRGHRAPPRLRGGPVSGGAAGTPIRSGAPAVPAPLPGGATREYGSAGSKPASAASARRPSSTSGENTDTQSSERQAGTTPADAHQAAGRLDADDPVEGRRHAARAGGVGPERERDDAVGDRDRRAGAGPARHVPRVEHAGARSVRRARADQARGELVHVRLADRAARPPPARRRDRRRRCRAARAAKAGTPAVVGMPATSMLSLTANGTPYSGRSRGPSASPPRSAQELVAVGQRDPRVVARRARSRRRGPARRPPRLEPLRPVRRGEGRDAQVCGRAVAHAGDRRPLESPRRPASGLPGGGLGGVLDVDRVVGSTTRSGTRRKWKATQVERQERVAERDLRSAKNCDLRRRGSGRRRPARRRRARSPRPTGSAGRS